MCRHERQYPSMFIAKRSGCSARGRPFPLGWGAPTSSFVTTGPAAPSLPRCFLCAPPPIPLQRPTNATSALCDSHFRRDQMSRPEGHPSSLVCVCFFFLFFVRSLLPRPLFHHLRVFRSLYVCVGRAPSCNHGRKQKRLNVLLSQVTIYGNAIRRFPSEEYDDHETCSIHSSTTLSMSLSFLSIRTTGSRTV